MVAFLAEGAPEGRPARTRQDERVYIVEIDTFASSHCATVLSATGRQVRVTFARNGAFNA